ncbi:MAG: hypothetical protein IJD38_12585 [Clostridia bacterium]|nr:hypothetical protein [Clostridia bacterium]
MSYARQAVTRLTLNMGLPEVQASFSCTAGDVNRRLEVTLIDHGEPFALPPDWTAFLAGIKPDGTRLANSCVVDKGRIIYDFAGGGEIATSPGMFTVVFEVYDGLGELVATPKVWVHVTDNVGVRIVNSADQFSILSELIGKISGAQEVVDMLKKMTSTGGTVTIPASEWTDGTPTMASISVSGAANGSVVLLLPANETTRLAAVNARLSAYPTVFASVGDTSPVSIFRAEAEYVPDKDMTFTYLVLKTGIAEKLPVAAIVGVDAYGEGGGTGGGGAVVDPEALNQVMAAVTAAQAYAESAQTSAEAAETARDAAESAAKRAEDAAGSAGGSGGAGASIVVGDVKPTSSCIWFNTSGYTSDPDPDPEPVKYTVSYNLTNCESREGGENFEVEAGSQFQDTISATEGYTLDTVTVTMGGSVVNVVDGAFYIASVTGDIVITAIAAANTYSITKNLTNCTVSNSTNTVSHGSYYSATITANEGYELQSVIVTMGGSAVNVTNGVISIASVTGDIVITATARVDNTPTYTVTVDNTHGGIMFVQGRPTEVEEGGTLYSQIAAQSGGNFSIHITMGGVDITDTAYTDDSSGSSANSNYGTIRVNNVNGDIVITIRPV